MTELSTHMSTAFDLLCPALMIQWRSKIKREFLSKFSKSKMQISKGGVTRPPSQIENNSQSVIRTRHLG